MVPNSIMHRLNSKTSRFTMDLRFIQHRTLLKDLLTIILFATLNVEHNLELVAKLDEVQMEYTYQHII